MMDNQQAGLIGIAVIVTVIVVLIWRILRSPKITPDNIDEYIKISDIPDKGVALRLVALRGRVVKVYKNISYGASVREIWIATKNGEKSVQVYGDYPVREGHEMTVVEDAITEITCGIVNHETGQRLNFVPGIEEVRQHFIKADELRQMGKVLGSMNGFELPKDVSAWGLQCVHVKARVDAYITSI